MDEPNILYEDNHIIVVMKPQGVPSCGDESGDDSLLEAVRRYIKVTYDKPGNVYVGLIHRLDRPTGGVMVFAKTSKAASRLAEQMRGGDFEKKYFAVLAGVPAREQKATLVNYLKKNPVNNMVYLCPPTTDGAKMASLDYEVLEEEGGLQRSCACACTRAGRIRSACRWRGMGCPRLRGYALRRGEREEGRARAVGVFARASRTPSRTSACAFCSNRPQTARRGSISTCKRRWKCDGIVKNGGGGGEIVKFLPKARKCV